MNESANHITTLLLRCRASLGRHWLLVTLLMFCAICLWNIWSLWLRIEFFGLPDTDDNQRMAQVRALLAGQDWYDLRQYRMNWPDGLNVHWSRLVDIPIAGLILILKPFLGPVLAERWAVTLAPMLPLGVLIIALSAISRRMVAPASYPLPIIILASGTMVMSMFLPLRIDHHGWQIALVGLLFWGLVDPNRLRGGLIAGLSTAFSIIIGLEMLPYLALGGAALVIYWIANRREEEALIGYAASLAFGTIVGILFFISYDNRGPVCDALSPVWYSTTLLASGVVGAFGFARIEGWRWRLSLALVAGVALTLFFVAMWPNCLGRPENVPEELNRLWLSNVREAKPITAQAWKVQLTTLSIPVLGAVGLILELWRNRHHDERFAQWAKISVLSLTSLALLFWQTRAGPAAQMFGVIGVTALAWRARHYKMALAFIVFSALMIQQFVDNTPDKLRKPEFVNHMLYAIGLENGSRPKNLSKEEKAKANRQAEDTKKRNAANGQCPTLTNMKILNSLPKGRMLTFVDLSPRLIVTTHHDAVTGPYHRNAQAILDIHHFFDGDEKNAREIVSRRNIDYVMICPNTNESTLYRARSPNGLYVVLANDKAPSWLEPMTLPNQSPYMVWKVKR